MHPEHKRLHEVITGEGLDMGTAPEDQMQWVSVYLGSEEQIPRVYTNRVHSHDLEWWQTNNGLVASPEFGVGERDRVYMSRYMEPREGAADGFEIVSEMTIPFVNARTKCKGAVMCETYDPDAFQGAWGYAESQAVWKLAERVAAYLGFGQTDEEPTVILADEILKTGDLHASGLQLVTTVSDRLIATLKAKPENLHNLSPTEFEKVIARLLLDDGHEVIVTPAQKDGGRDIIAVTHTSAGTFITIVECKKWRPERPVPIEVVRGVYGVLQHERASHAMIVTTSRFTADARAFRDTVRYQLSLRNFDDVANWLTKHA